MQCINLGRCKNKYLIIDILFSAGEEDPQREAEILLWDCRRNHRAFLGKNYDWYPRNLSCVWVNLKSQSKELETAKQGRFLLDHIRINGMKEVSKVTRIFTATRDGWEGEDFHRFCDGKGPTLCLIRSTRNYLSAGFTSVAWSSPEEYAHAEDASAMVFALTNEPKMYKVNNAQMAVMHGSASGPWF